MRIFVQNRQTGEILLDLDVNAEGNIHELVLEHRGSRFVVSGASYESGIFIKADPFAPVMVRPEARDEILVRAS